MNCRYAALISTPIGAELIAKIVDFGVKDIVYIKSSVTFFPLLFYRVNCRYAALISTPIGAELIALTGVNCQNQRFRR